MGGLGGGLSESRGREGEGLRREGMDSTLVNNLGWMATSPIRHPTRVAISDLRAFGLCRRLGDRGIAVLFVGHVGGLGGRHCLVLFLDSGARQTVPRRLEAVGC